MNTTDTDVTDIMRTDAPELRSAAFKEAFNRKTQVALLGITPDMTEEELDKKVMELATAKAAKVDQAVNSLVAGQEWYVKELIAFAGMTSGERYLWGRSQSFADTASDNELLDALMD